MDQRMIDHIKFHLEQYRVMNIKRPELMRMSHSVMNVNYRGFMPMAIRTVEQDHDPSNYDVAFVFDDSPRLRAVSFYPVFTVSDYFEDDDIDDVVKRIYSCLCDTLSNLESDRPKLEHLETNPNDHQTFNMLSRSGRDCVAQMKHLYQELKRVNPELLERVLKEKGILTILSYTNITAEEFSDKATKTGSPLAYIVYQTTLGRM